MPSPLTTLCGTPLLPTPPRSRRCDMARATTPLSPLPAQAAAPLMLGLSLLSMPSAAIELLLPTAVPDLQASFLNDLLTPTIGTDASLVAACGALESTSTAFDASCLQAWYAADPSPSRLGQVLAYD